MMQHLSRTMENVHVYWKCLIKKAEHFNIKGFKKKATESVKSNNLQSVLLVMVIEQGF